MGNLTVNFAYEWSPWLFLLLIPGIALTLIPYFKLNKRYRRTRNRIISMVLHVCIMIIAISLFTGMYFEYDVPNNENEIMLVVDVSYSNSDSQQAKDDYVEQVLSQGMDRFKMGIVMFGYKPKYIAELTNDNELTYARYLQARRNSDIDVSATDIGAAIDYVVDGELFANPTTAKIILISDGVETDGDAESAIRKAAAQGITVDTVCFANADKNDVRIVSVDTPTYNFDVGETINYTLHISSTIATDVNLKMTHNDNQTTAKVGHVPLHAGENIIYVDDVFDIPGVYKVDFTITNDHEDSVEGADLIEENNTYCTYVNLVKFKNVLVLERYQGESDAIKGVLEADEYTVTVVNLADENKVIPSTLDELRQYDEIVLVNVSDSDLVYTGPSDDIVMPEKFDVMLNDYVKKAGGGLFAVAGCEPGTENATPTAHSFNVSDMAASQDKSNGYAALLPVEAVNYTPPAGTMLIIDRSDSMKGDTDGHHPEASDKDEFDSTKQKLQLAKNAALNAIKSFTYRDYVGVMSFDDGVSEESPMLNAYLHRSEIESRIANIREGGNTVFYGALQKAYQALVALGDTVEYKNVILITDGRPSDDIAVESGGMPAWGPLISYYRETHNIGFSCIYFGAAGTDEYNTMARAVTEYGANSGQIFSYANSDAAMSVTEDLKTVVTAPQRLTIEYGEYKPEIESFTNIVKGITYNALEGEVSSSQSRYQLNYSLKGYIGTRLKDGATVTLSGPNHVPLYAQHTYGNGRVGAFLCPLTGKNWSENFMGNNDSTMLIRNIVKSLMPTESIRPCDINVSVNKENYTTRLNIFTGLEEGEKVNVTVTDFDNNVLTPLDAPDETEAYSMATYNITSAGIYHIVVEKLDENGVVKLNSRYETYRNFSYSEEYSIFLTSDESTGIMTELAAFGNGEVLTEPQEVFHHFVTTWHRSYDPSMILLIVAIILFLLDIAVRKFKFKWLHEIIRDRKAKKELTNNRGLK